MPGTPVTRLYNIGAVHCPVDRHCQHGAVIRKDVKTVFVYHHQSGFVIYTICNEEVFDAVCGFDVLVACYLLVSSGVVDILIVAVVNSVCILSLLTAEVLYSIQECVNT